MRNPNQIYIKAHMETDLGTTNTKVDEAAVAVRAFFHRFLHEFTQTTENEEFKVYVAQVASMKQDNRSTIYVDINHVEEYNADLAKLIIEEYLR